jgi:AraC family transcriptional regulator
MIEDIPELHLCGDFVVRRGWKLGPRTIEEHELVYFPMGTDTIYRSEDQKYVLDRPTWVITRAGSKHSYSFGETAATRHLFVHFNGGNRYAPTLLDPQGPHILLSGETEFQAVLMSHILQTAHAKNDPYRCNILLATLLSELEHTYSHIKVKPIKKQANPDPLHEKKTAPYPHFVSEALSYIRNRLIEPLSVADIATYCQMSHEHLTRSFVRVMGMPPQQVIIKLRLERATHLLRNTTLSIKEIASQCGFSESHYFSRTFVSNYGLTASSYRNKWADPRIQHMESSRMFNTIYPMNTFVLFKS